MKKNLLTTILMVLAIILPISSLAQNIIQFEDDAVKALCVANWDTDGDGELSYDEAAAVTDLGEVFKGNTEIVRFFELEYFSGLTAIGNNAFYDCGNLQEIRLPQTITNIGSAAFFSDENLMFIELPEELKTIGHAAFGICRSLKSLFIPASVTSINGTAFRDCTGLESITVNEQNTIYDSRSQCNAIIETSTNTLITGCRTTVIPEGIVAIGRYAFYGHYEIKTLDFPSTLEIIGENSFNGTGFVTLDIPNSVTTIAFWAFTNCHSLESVRISSSVKEIDRPFINCGNLKFIVVDEGNTVYDSRNNCNGIIETTTNRIIVGCNTTIIPDGVVSIGSQAFASTQIQSLILPESVTSIEEMAFWSSNIASIEIPEKMATIGSNAFADCNKLESIRSYIKKPFVINENTFLDITYQNATLFVRTGTKTAYQNTEAWNHFANIEEFGDPVALDPEPYAVLSENNTVLTFYYDTEKEQRNGMSVGPFENLGSYGVSTEWYDNRSTITTVVFDDSFANCTTLTSTAYWFYQLTKLTTIKGIQNLKTDNVNDINSMFCDCESLTSLDLSNLNLGNVTNMHQVFEGCTGLENIIFDGVNTENVTNMGDLFLNCSSLKTIDLSSFNTNKVTNMRSMFYRCTSLTTVYVSDSWTTASVTESNNMFERCYSIVGGKGTTFDENYIDATYARIDGGPNSQMPGYFTYKDAPVVSGDFGNRMLLLWRQVGGKEYKLYKALDKNQYRTNADGWKMYLTQLTLDIVDGNDITTVVVDEGTIYTDDNRYNDATIASMMIDKERNMMYVFNNSKADGGGYSMNGYAYLSPVDQPAFNKEMVFEDSNWGWFSIFTGTTSDGQPVLSHFSYAGYYEMVSTRTQEGYWTSESLDNIMPDDMNARWAKTNKVTVVGDTSDDEVTVDGLVYTLRSNNQAAISWVNEKDQLEQLKLPSQINHGGTVRTVTAIAPFAFYWCNNLHELNIPSSVSQIEELALRKCSALEKLRVDNVTPPYLKNDEEVTPFDEATCENAILYVPYGAKAAYQETNGWKDFKNIEEFGDPVALDAEPYAALSDNNTVLTFYYDDQKANRNGMDVGPFYWDTQSWLDQKDLITTVVFDNSFAECTTITSTSLWFTRFSQLTNIIGISNLNTNNVTDMSWMFCDCPKLESLDLSNFNTANVTSMREMFGRTTLKQIDLSSFNTENVTDFEYMFDNSPNLTNINMSSFSTKSVTNFINMFSGCSSLASIQAGSAEIPAEEYTKIGNPNLLLYVNEARLAPEGVQNVVVNGVAKEIVLTDNPDGKIVNNNWYCPEPFRAEKISYTRDFRQQTQIGISRGWESLALPFAVQTITHQDKGVIAPFGSDASGLHFWLRRLGHEGLISVQMIEPNTPYIISMPNSEDYASRFNLNGRVTFAAEDAYVERTEQMADESADYMMVPAFQRMPVSEYVYALNVGEERNGRPEGSIFERNYREVRPFEAYTLHRGDQPAPLFFDLSDLEGSTTDVPGVRWMMDDGNGEWYDLQGRKLGSTFNVQRSTLKKGVYIYNGRKTVVK